MTGFTWSLDDGAGWFAVPTTSTHPAHEVAAWEAAVASAVRRKADELLADDKLPAELGGLPERTAEASVAALRTFADKATEAGTRVVATLGVLDRGPMPATVTVGTSPASEPEDLMAVLTDSPDVAWVPARTEYLDLPDGDGVRVTRVDVDRATGTAWASIAVGRRTEHEDVVVDTVLRWTGEDLFAASAMAEAFDHLLPAVRVVRTTPGGES